MSTSTDKQWRVQTQAATGRWINRGLFETRESAREDARHRKHFLGQVTKVVRYVKGE